MKKDLLHTPEGVRDIYNGECARKIVLQNRLHDVCALYGYNDIQTPSFEFFDVFNKERGIVPRMRELADKKLQITLALSLHASTQEKRLELMPVANKYEIHEVIDACRYYFEQTGRRITFEYSLVGGVNDTDEDVRNLCRLIKGINCHVNLIPVNPIKERDYVQPDVRVTTEFKNKLEKNGINATIRREMGRDIDGACGQLRKRYMGS